MNEFDKIYLSWRPGLGLERFIVGMIQKDSNGNVSFKYDKEEVELAKKSGFLPYTEFPEVDNIYKSNVLDIFGQRLMKTERSDIQKFYDFWEIEPKYFHDKFYLLGHTQGLLPTDNFEFLADYNPIEKLHFLTDLAGLSIFKNTPDKLAINDELTIRYEPDNNRDKDAVSVYNRDVKIGYIKKIHCRVFHKEGKAKLRIKVKATDKNGIIKRAR